MGCCGSKSQPVQTVPSPAAQSSSNTYPSSTVNASTTEKQAPAQSDSGRGRDATPKTSYGAATAGGDVGSGTERAYLSNSRRDERAAARFALTSSEPSVAHNGMMRPVGEDGDARSTMTGFTPPLNMDIHQRAALTKASVPPTRAPTHGAVPPMPRRATTTGENGLPSATSTHPFTGPNRRNTQLPAQTSSTPKRNADLEVIGQAAFSKHSSSAFTRSTSLIDLDTGDSTDSTVALASPIQAPTRDAVPNRSRVHGNHSSATSPPYLMPATSATADDSALSPIQPSFPLADGDGTASSQGWKGFTNRFNRLLKTFRGSKDAKNNKQNTDEGPGQPVSKSTDDTPGGVAIAKASQSPLTTTNPALLADNGVVTVYPIEGQLSSTAMVDDSDLVRIREKCPRFRVLIIGRANAGKTTILRKMCETGMMQQEPTIRDQHGNILGLDSIKPTRRRGQHVISDEFTISTNEAFVFHDSPGFESGSNKELEDVQKFIADCAKAPELKNQLHAIWYCLPLDNKRTCSKVEMSFFEKGTGNTPVIAIFTKYDGMILDEFNKLRFGKDPMPVSEAKVKASINANKAFLTEDCYLMRVKGARYPPACVMRFQDMQEPENQCPELSKYTLEALNSKNLKLLFVSVQQNNIALSTVFAIKEFVQDALVKVVNGSISTNTTEEMVRGILSCYGHLFSQVDYAEHKPEVHPQQQDIHNAFKVLKPEIDTMAGQGTPLTKLLRIGTAVPVIAERSFWLKNKEKSGVQALTLAVDQYKSPSVQSDVMEKVNQRFGDVDVQELPGDKLVDMVLGVVWEPRFTL